MWNVLRERWGKVAVRIYSVGGLWEEEASSKKVSRAVN